MIQFYYSIKKHFEKEKKVNDWRCTYNRHLEDVDVVFIYLWYGDWVDYDLPILLGFTYDVWPVHLTLNLRIKTYHIIELVP